MRKNNLIIDVVEKITTLSRQKLYRALSKFAMSVKSTDFAGVWHRLSLIAYRWLSMAFLVTFSSFVVVFTMPLYKTFINRYCEYASSFSPFFMDASLFISSAAVTILLLRLFVVHPENDLTGMLCHPPIWLAAIATAAGVLYFMPMTTESALHRWVMTNTLSLAYPCIICFMGAASVVVVYSASDRVLARHQHNKPITVEQLRGAVLNDSHKKTIAWLMSNSPILLPEHDRYGHNLHAIKIVSYLTENKAFAIAVLGPHGCGKSCVVSLTEHYLVNGLPNNKHHKITSNYITNKISGWGISPENLTTVILESSIRKLGKKVDCLSLLNLPKHYRAMLASAGSNFGSAISCLLADEKDPIQLLQKLNAVLVSTNRKIIIILEDIDRNENAEALTSSVAGLLDRLGRLSHIAFILALSTNSTKHDALARICDFREAIA
jgi:hypothetical protein